MSGRVSDVHVVEVGPRDGLQNQSREIATATKVGWIERLAKAGLPEIEATSFVHPKWVPQLADASDVARGLPRDADTLFSALVPNRKGLDGALAAGFDRIALFTAASESFNQKNINASIAESLDRFREIFAAVSDRSMFVRGYVSCCFGCPYEGTIDPRAVAKVSKTLVDLGCDVIGISDTIGVATPKQVDTVLDAVLGEIPVEAVALHFHDTRGTALVNVVAGLERGVRIFDASAGGLGGCPYAPGATGNLATEDLIYLLDGLGVSTGVDLDALAAANLWFEESFDTPFPSRVLSTYR